MFIIPKTDKSWTCLPASFSMACGVSFDAFMELLGHDGDSYPYADKTHRRGFHIQECIDVAFSLGYTCTPIEKSPAMAYSYDTIDQAIPVYFPTSNEDNLARFMHYIKSTKRGVLEGARSRNGKTKGHACAWDGEKVYDPSGRIYTFEESLKNNFLVISLWVLTKAHPYFRANQGNSI